MSIKENNQRKHNIKFNIQGFNQLEAIRLGLNNDDLTVLRWFIDFKNTGKMEKNYISEINDMGHWVKYSTLVDSLPILLKDSNKYLEEYIELEKAAMDLDEKAYKKLYDKFMEKHLKKVQRILSGNLSKVLKRDITRLGENKGSKVYLYIDVPVYERLVSNTTIEDFLKDNGINNVPDKVVQNTVDKVVQYELDKVVQSNSSTTNSSTSDSSTTKSEDKPLVVETNKELIESKTHLELSKPQQKKVSAWNKDRLLKAIDIFINENGEYFSFLEKIYKDDGNFAPKKASKTTSGKTKFHNINQTFKKYEAKELEKLLQDNQKDKFKNDNVEFKSEDKLKALRERQAAKQKQIEEVATKDEVTSGGFKANYMHHFEN